MPFGWCKRIGLGRFMSLNLSKRGASQRGGPTLLGPKPRGKHSGAVIVLSEPDNEPAVLIHWPPAASVASPAAFPTVASKITAVVANAAVKLAQTKASRL
jgi:hypothetical protein